MKKKRKEKGRKREKERRLTMKEKQQEKEQQENEKTRKAQNTEEPMMAQPQRWDDNKEIMRRPRMRETKETNR